jgi:hypothetical protein
MISCYKNLDEAEKNIKFINQNDTGTLLTDNVAGVPMLHFRKLYEFDWLSQSFSTRLGGVSGGIYESMNLSFNLMDSKENVLNNFKKIAKTIGISVENMVYSKQTHTTNILKVNEHHKGMGIVRDRDFDNIDGLITDRAGVCLVTSFADCIPVIIIDPVKRVVASLHSGWRGTVGNISQRALDIMAEDYGCIKEDCYGFVGPGICQDCYEISSDVADEFKNSYTGEETDVILKNGKNEGKYNLDLLAANRINLANGGIKTCNIFTADLCTCCNPGFLWSHRATGGKRGLMCNFIYIKEPAND